MSNKRQSKKTREAAKRQDALYRKIQEALASAPKELPELLGNQPETISEHKALKGFVNGLRSRIETRS